MIPGSGLSISTHKTGGHRRFLAKSLSSFASRLSRNADGRFKDGDLANILHNATSWYAGAFKARGIPETLRVVEIMAIEQSRTWGTCSVSPISIFGFRDLRFTPPF